MVLSMYCDYTHYLYSYTSRDMHVFLKINIIFLNYTCSAFIYFLFPFVANNCSQKISKYTLIV